MSEIRKQLTMKAASEIFKLAAKLNIKPKDIIGMGGDIVKMGKSLFTEKVNPKLTEYISKKGDVPPKILEEIKIHIRSLKNASDNQIELFKLNLKDIVNAKSPVSSVKQPATSVKELSPLKQFEKNLEADAAGSKELFKGWTPTVIKGGKEPKFNSGGVAKLNAELNQLPEYYLPLAAGGRARYSFGEGPVMEETGNMDFLSSLTQEEVDADPERYAQLLIGLRKPDFFMGEGDSLRAYFKQPDGGSISVPWGFKGYGLSYDQTIDFKTGGIANHFRKK